MSRLSRAAIFPVLLASIATVAFSQTSDTTPPTLVSLSFTPSAVDVTAGPQNIVVTVHITDNLAGVSAALVSFTSPSGTQRIPLFGTGGVLSRTSGTALDGIYQGTIQVPQFVQSGVWKVSMGPCDLVDNCLSLTPANIQALGLPTDLTITSIPDTSAPIITGVAITPSSVDVSSGPQSVTLTLQLTDNLSGVDFTKSTFGLPIVFQSPVSQQQQYISSLQPALVTGTPLNGTWSATVSIPQFSEPGLWKITQIVLSDKAGNIRLFTAADLASSGFTTNLNVVSTPADTTPPSITSFNFSPAIIDTSTSSQLVTVRINISDALAGVDFSPETPNSSSFHGVTFVSPSGGQLRQCCFFPGTPPGLFQLVAGTATNGTWEVGIQLPRFSEAGTWKASVSGVKDGVRNSTNLTTANLASRGFQTDLVVQRPSLVTDGSAGSAGGTITDETFGGRASVTFPTGALPGNTDVAIDVLTPNVALGIPTPAGFSTRSLFVNINLTPTPPMPFPAPGLTVILPLTEFRTAGSTILLFRLDPVSGLLVPAVSVSGGNVVGTVGSDGLSATFTGVSHLSTVVGFEPIAVPGDVNSDQIVNCADVTIVRAAFGKKTGDIGFNIKADLNANGVVDVSDLILVTRRLAAGTSCN